MAGVTVTVTGVMVVAATLSSRVTVAAVGAWAWGEEGCGHQEVEEEGEEETGVVGGVLAMREAENLRGTQSLPLI